MGAGDAAGALAASPESSASSTHLVAYNHLYL